MNHKDYSYINNLEDLHKEIQLVRFRATESRLRLEEKFTQLPKETLRKLGSSVTNFLFLRNKAITSVGLIKNAIGFFLPRKEAASEKKPGVIRKLGIYAGLYGLTLLFKKRK
ncbi:MAG TPA: hypothetical protein PKM63_19430 [Panacibacter sp.]|nr:hypothetical protein [Panacibacter sp.]HNP46476.1 hypothetical protein [Panacibacter sp.]